MMIHDKLQNEFWSIKLRGYSLCPGNPEEHFIELLIKRKGQIKSRDGKSVSATLDYNGVVYKSKFYSKTVRASSCQKIEKG